jgi:hypothetical protein
VVRIITPFTGTFHQVLVQIRRVSEALFPLGGYK